MCRNKTFFTAIFYTQIIEKFVVAIPDMIESRRSTKKSQEIKNRKNAMQRTFPVNFLKFASFR